MTITLYSKASYDPKNPTIGYDIAINDYFKGVLTGRWQDEIIKWRNIKDEIKRNEKKRFLLPCVTVSGKFKGRNDSDLAEYSGLLCIDIDAKDNERPMSDIRDELREIAEIYAIHYSVSGKGLAVYFRVQKKAEMHERSFEAIVQMLVNDYKVIPDLSCSNISRLRFVSYDPDLYLNQDATCWDKFLPKPKKSEPTPRRYDSHIYSSYDIDFIVDQITSRGIDIAPSYLDWLRIGFALAGEFGEGGRKYFIAISDQFTGKQQTKPNRQYDNCLRHGSKRISIGTFFYYAKQAGIEITSKRTREIKSVARIRKKQSLSSNGGSKDWKKDGKEYLKKNNNIDGDDVDEIFEKTDRMPTAELEGDSDGGTTIDSIELYLRSNWEFKYNEITGGVECDGEMMTDKQFNDIYLGAKKVVSEKVSKELVGDIIHSSFSIEYNPLKQWFEDNKHIESTGNIKAICDCIHTRITNEDPTFVYDFVEKWLLSIVGSVFGTHSVMKLMLTGKGMGIGKSKFFQHLLPDALQNYFSSDPLSDNAQHFAMQMCQNLLLFDDENSSTAKRGIDNFKAYSDASKFRVRLPYGKYITTLQRLAVLCGASNNDAVIDDTDNRRIIPISVYKIDLDKFYAINKTNLFIELYHLWSTGKNYFITPEDKERLNKVTSGAYDVCDELDLAQKYFKPSEKGALGAEFMTASDIHVELKRLTGFNTLSSKKISKVMAGSNFERVRYLRDDGSQPSGFWVFRKYDSTGEIRDKYNDEDDMPF